MLDTVTSGRGWWRAPPRRLTTKWTAYERQRCPLSGSYFPTTPTTTEVLPPRGALGWSRIGSVHALCRVESRIYKPFVGWVG